MTTMPRPVTAKQTWRDSARCLRVDPEVFYPASWTSAEGQLLTQLAQRICGACPVRLQCLDAAITAEGGRSSDNRFGIIGGLTPLERLRAYRRRIAAAGE